MQSHGIKPDSVSLVSAVLACSKVGHLKLGKSIHGYGIHGHGNEALSLFVEMTGTDAKPDHTTFASLLSALSHSGLVEAGQYWFHKMVYEFKIQASEKLVVCMVDLLSRAGRVEEAYQLIESMDSEPGLAVWVALLSGCHNYKNISIGEEAAKKILASNANDSGTYSLVSNFFSMAKKWDEVRGSRRMMKRTGLRKVPGFSAVEVNGKHQAFLMEDRTHHQYEGIIQILDNLAHEMTSIRSTHDVECFMYDLVGD
ncbi:Putative pentatricopeptide repeat-containing protein At3g25060, mitochondrial [Linum grandiflorum]